MINVQENILKLRRVWFGIAIDDFGTGEANFSLLTESYITSIKIDKAFIHGINLSTPKALRNKSLIKLFIWFAHQFWLTVIAEWVENEQEQIVVETLWAHYSQGYLFSRPAPYDSNL